MVKIIISSIHRLMLKLSSMLQYVQLLNIADKNAQHVQECTFQNHCGLRYLYLLILKNVSVGERLLRFQIQNGLIDETNKLKIGDVQDFTSFTSAVIDNKAYERITSYIDHAKSSSDLKIIAGGTYSDKVGYFVNPTIVVTTNPLNKIMREEIFGPVLTIYVYPDKDLKKAMDLVNNSTKFALTGAVFAQDEYERVFFNNKIFQE